MKKLIVVLGPTASGKTDLSIKLAKRFNGEVISADSRQVYKGMDIGTGKVTKNEMHAIPHYLLDVVNPKKVFTVSDFKKLADKAISKIYKKNKLPFLVGGTGFYIQAVAEGITAPEVEPDWELRKKLEKETTDKLFEKLEKLDKERAKTIDRHNRRRLIRALEIILKTNKPVPKITAINPDFEVLYLGIKKPKKELKDLIEKRLLKRLKAGMLDEEKKLRKSGVSWKRLEEFGLEYRYMAYYLQGKLTYEEFIERLNKEIEHYAKRQMTWFKRNKKIKWVKSYGEAKKLVDKFVNN